VGVEVVAVLAATLVSIVPSLLIDALRRWRKESTEIGEDKLSENLARLQRLSEEAGELLPVIAAELNSRTATVERLRTEAEESARIVAVTREQREAVARLLRAEMRLEGRKDRIFNVALNVIFFGAGVSVTLLIK
jgi:hypothetical protein